MNLTVNRQINVIIPHPISITSLLPTPPNLKVAPIISYLILCVINLTDSVIYFLLSFQER